MSGELQLIPRQWFLAVVCLGLSMLSGCQKSDRPATYPASGKVVFPDGRPLSSGAILCEAVDQPYAARGMIRDGQFQLGTFADADGAVAGRHRVAIVPAPADNVDPDAGGTAPEIDPRFLHMDTSELEVLVEPEQPNTFTIRVTRNGQK
ncbi:MAG: hypothetical protein U0795_21785 [Pirellulales bacterium]